MLYLRDINFRNDPDSSVLGILHNLLGIFLSVVPVLLIIAGCELGEAICTKFNIYTEYSYYAVELYTCMCTQRERQRLLPEYQYSVNYWSVYIAARMWNSHQALQRVNNGLVSPHRMKASLN